MTLYILLHIILQYWKSAMIKEFITIIAINCNSNILIFIYWTITWRMTLSIYSLFTNILIINHTTYHVFVDKPILDYYLLLSFLKCFCFRDNNGVTTLRWIVLSTTGAQRCRSLRTWCSNGAWSVKCITGLTLSSSAPDRIQHRFSRVHLRPDNDRQSISC